MALPCRPASSGVSGVSGVVRRYSARFGASSASVRVRPVSVGARTQTATAGWCDPSNGCRSASLCRLRESGLYRTCGIWSACPSGFCGTGPAVYLSARLVGLSVALSASSAAPPLLQRAYFLLLGASIMFIFLPSSLGIISTLATSSRSVAKRSSRISPCSLKTIERPRKKT